MKKLAILYFILVSSPVVCAQEVVEEVFIEEVSEEQEDLDVPFAVIEEVPVYPGCEKLIKSDKRACFQKNMIKHISKNFNFVNKDSIASGVKKIYVLFTIDKDGLVKNVKARGPHPTLELEGKRVVKLLPRMTPGKQRGKKVNVNYVLPITFTLD